MSDERQNDKVSGAPVGRRKREPYPLMIVVCIVIAAVFLVLVLGAISADLVRTNDTAPAPRGDGVAWPSLEQEEREGDGGGMSEGVQPSGVDYPSQRY